VPELAVVADKCIAFKKDEAVTVKMVVMDLDGTLLRGDKTLSAYTKNILVKCREKGIKVVYATGRGGSAKRLAPCELFDGKITMNGATATVGDEVVYNRTIPWQTAQPILIACHNRGMEIVSENGGKHYANFSVTDRWPSLMADDERTDFSQHRINAEKIYIPNPTPEDRAFIEKMLPDDLYFVITGDGEDSFLGQIMHRDATKGQAILALANLWSICPQVIAAFGDDYNDMDMLQGCGIGVAMGNAILDIKNIATYICDTDENDGVAKWLEANIIS
jgi:hypothetical protein